MHLIARKSQLSLKNIHFPNFLRLYRLLVFIRDGWSQKIMTFNFLRIQKYLKSDSALDYIYNLISGSGCAPNPENF